MSLNEISEKIGNAAAEPVLFTGFQHLQPYIDQLNDLHGSIVFQDLWHEHTSQPLEPVDSLEKLLQSVIRPIFASWQRLYLRIKRGTVTAFDVQRYFGKVFLSKENLEKELKMMLKYIDFESSLSDWLNERIEQILLFGRRHFVCSISKLVRKICEALGAERITLCPLFTFNEVFALSLNRYDSKRFYFSERAYDPFARLSSAPETIPNFSEPRTNCCPKSVIKRKRKRKFLEEDKGCGRRG